MRKIYTKRGDTGKTSLADGSSVLKTDPILEAFGTLDELNSYIGYFRCLSNSDKQDITKSKYGYEFYRMDKTLVWVQNKIHNISAVLAASGERNQDLFKRLSVKTEDIGFIESEIDWMDSQNDELKSIILYNGNQLSTLIYVIRSICRKSERLICSLKETGDKNIIPFINRLSDYFFIQARFINTLFEIDEEKWDIDFPIPDFTKK